MNPRSTIRRRVGAVYAMVRMDGKGSILITVSIGWLLAIGVRQIYPALLPFFTTSFGIDLTQAGLLLGVLMVGYGVGQFPGGVLGDRFGTGNILVFSTVLSAVGLMLVAASSSVALLFIGSIVFGFATALFAPTRITIFTDLFPDRSGSAVGLTYAAGSVGNAALPVIAVGIAAAVSWRVSYWVLIPAFVLTAVGLRVAVPARSAGKRPVDDLVSARAFRDILDAVRVRGVPVAAAVQIMVGFVSQGFLGFYPTYLIVTKGLSPELAATVFGLYFAMGTVVQPASGVSKDRFGTRSTLVVLCSVFTVGLLLLHAVDGIVHIVLVTVLLSGRGGIGVITNTFIAETLPSTVKGSSLGLLRTVWISIGATSPVVVGYFGDLGRLEFAYLLLAVVVGAATALSPFVRGTAKGRA